MNPAVAIRRCTEYDLDEVLRHISWLYEEGGGPDPKGKKVLVKPNILSDEDPVKAMTTHPVVVEAVVRYLQSRGAIVLVGDSPTIDTRTFTGRKCGLRQVAEKCGAEWVRFTDGVVSRKIGSSEVSITDYVTKADLLIPVSKLKTHELMIISGAIKNIFGFIPGFSKAMQHVNHPDRNKLGSFLVDLEEGVRPHFHIMDAIVAMEGPGPGNGNPKRVNVLLASANPLALDITASRIIGYDPLVIPTNRIALERGSLLKSTDEIVIKGPDPETLVARDFKRIYKGGEAGILLKHLRMKLPLIRRFDKRPVFNNRLCIGCSKCIDMCLLRAIHLDDKRENTVIIDDTKCIRCYCCSEVCREGAIEIRRKLF